MITKREGVLNAIRRAVLNGELKPGERVKESALADLLGVSRPTVREAIMQLVHEGSFVQVPYKGISVARPSDSDIRDVAELRVVLESFAAIEVARSGNPEAIAAIRAALDRHLEALGAGDPLAADLTHLELHRSIWMSSGNRMLMRVWPLVESQIPLAMSVDQAPRLDLDRDAELHRLLVEVIESKDEAAIEAEVRRHIFANMSEAALAAEPGR
jgi:DNA-binding GntR family transcriptional regulator